MIFGDHACLYDACKALSVRSSRFRLGNLDLPEATSGPKSLHAHITFEAGLSCRRDIRWVSLADTGSKETDTGGQNWGKETW